MEDRRTILKSALALGLGVRGLDVLHAQADDPRKARPQEGDRFVFAFGPRQGETVQAADVPLASEQLICYAMDPVSGAVRDGSRLNQVLLLRFEPESLAPETSEASADGVVAYSGVCTHTGCDIEDYSAGYYMTLAPLAVEGRVMVGVSGGEWGIRGFVAAYDADTGDELWKTYTIPGPGEPGHESWPGDTWRTGGVPVWVTGNYDPELRLTYWGTGNGGPWMGDARPGDNLYATSVLALDVDTGDIRAHHQYHWNDSWDWDEVDPPLLIDVERDGRTRKALVHPGRNAYLWVLERSADSIDFLDATRFVYQDVFTSIDPETGHLDGAIGTRTYVPQGGVLWVFARAPVAVICRRQRNCDAVPPSTP